VQEERSGGDGMTPLTNQQRQKMVKVIGDLRKRDIKSTPAYRNGYITACRDIEQLIQSDSVRFHYWDCKCERCV